MPGGFSLLHRLPPHFDFGEVIHLAGGVAVGLDTQEAALHALAVDQLSFVSFEISEIRSDVEARGIVVVVVE